MDVSIDAITNNIQLALAPVFLLTAVALLALRSINTLLGKLAPPPLITVEEVVATNSAKETTILLLAPTNKGAPGS